MIPREPTASTPIGFPLWRDNKTKKPNLYLREKTAAKETVMVLIPTPVAKRRAVCDVNQKSIL